MTDEEIYLVAAVVAALPISSDDINRAALAERAPGLAELLRRLSRLATLLDRGAGAGACVVPSGLEGRKAADPVHAVIVGIIPVVEHADFEGAGRWRRGGRAFQEAVRHNVILRLAERGHRQAALP